MDDLNSITSSENAPGRGTKRPSPSSDADADAKEDCLEVMEEMQVMSDKVPSSEAPSSYAAEDVNSNKQDMSDTKRAQKLAMNRESARARRNQKKIKMQSLELRNEMLAEQNQSLAAAKDALTRRITELERELGATRSTFTRDLPGAGSLSWPSFASAAGTTTNRLAGSGSCGVPAGERKAVTNLMLRLEAERASLLAGTRDEASLTSSSLLQSQGADLSLFAPTTTRSQPATSTRTFIETSFTSRGSNAAAPSQHPLLSGDMSARGRGMPLSSTTNELQYLRLLSEARSRGDLLTSDALIDHTARVQAQGQLRIQQQHPSLHQHASNSGLSAAHGATSTMNRLLSGVNNSALRERRRRLDDIFERIGAAGARSGPVEDDETKALASGYR